MNAFLPALGLCALLTALPVGAAPDPLAQGSDDHDAQVIGWSSNGKRFAVRLYTRDVFVSHQVGDEKRFCPGYVNHEDNPFQGGLVLLAYERGRLLSAFPIHDKEQCTPPEVAKARLEDAKKKLGALGIQLESPGQQLFPEGNGPRLSVAEGHQAPYTLEYEERTLPQASDAKSGRQRGTVEQEVYVRKGDVRKKVLTRKAPYEYATAMAGYLRTGLDRVWVSPSGTTLVVLGYERVGNMSGGRKSLRLMGVLGWAGTTLKPL